VTFADAWALALRNLRQSKLRTFLTVLGVSIGIASLAGMVSLGVGLQDQFVGRFMRSGMFDSVNVMPGQDPRVMLGGRGRGGRGGRGGRAGEVGQPADVPPRTLDDSALADLAKLEHVKDVYPVVRVPVEVKFGDTTEYAAATGVPMSSRGIGAFQTIAHGEFLQNETAADCMISMDFANRLVQDKPQQLVGKTLSLGYAAAPVEAPAGQEPPPPTRLSIPQLITQVKRAESPCRVVGIVERETGPMPVGGSNVAAVMLPLPRAKEINAAVVATQRSLMRNRADSMFQAVVVKVTEAQRTQDVQGRIRKMGFTAFSLNDALEGAKRAFLILDILLGLTGSIALAVASLGIMNTMVMSILERTREIGIMKAIGGSDADVRKIFLIEASAIGLLGGIAGVLLGWIVGRIINFGANYYIVNQGGTPGNLFSLPLWLIAASIGFSIFVSLAAGSYPARRAARLDPIQALRHD
jgi:putative ABC transport system permease protein